jgi:hypothetical protein
MGILYLLLTAFIGIFGLLAAKNQAQTRDAAMLPAMLTGVTFLFILGMIGVMHILTGRAFRAGKGWARIVTWILAIINLGNVPLGTAIGSYTIWVLVKTREEVKNIK